MQLITVSVIEDDKSYREGLVTLINNSGTFTILHTYRSAEEAIPHIIQHPPDIAMVDIKLPGRNGVQLISSIRQEAPAVLCMVCSFYDDDEFIFTALKNGACGYILKDSMPQEILDSLKELHQGGAPMSRYIAKKVISSFQKQAHPKLAELTERENEILELVATGLVVKEAAVQLNLSSHTVTKHLKNIYTKLHVNNRVEAVNRLNRPGTRNL
jgi:NarL family two-component system response regulator LiaR